MGKHASPFQEPSPEQWAALFETAQEIKRLEPWNLLWDHQIIEIVLPDRQEAVYLTVLGRNGTCYAVGVYPGERALTSLVQIMQDDAPYFTHYGRQNCLMCNFGCREDVTAKDRETYQALGLKFRGKNQWIYFRSHKPGYGPWHLEAGEAQLLLAALQQFVEIFRAFAAGDTTADFDGGEILLRRYDAGRQAWINEATPFPNITFEVERITVTDELFIARMRRMDIVGVQLSLDIFYAPFPIRDTPSEVSRFPQLLLLADNASMMVLDFKVAEPDQSAGELAIQVLSDFILRAGRPQALCVRDEFIAGYVADLCEQCDIALIKNQGLPVIDELADDLLNNFMK